MQLRQVGESYRIQLCARKGYTLRECAIRIRLSALHVIINSTNIILNSDTRFNINIAILAKTFAFLNTSITSSNLSYFSSKNCS